MKRYTLFDHFKNTESSYYDWEFTLAFGIVYVVGVVTGIIVIGILT
jgi:hypothetical protein